MAHVLTVFQVLDGAIIIAAFILNPRAAKRRRRNAETGEMAEVATLGPVLVAPTPEPSSATITRAATPSANVEKTEIADPLPDLPENQRRRTEDEI